MKAYATAASLIDPDPNQGLRTLFRALRRPTRRLGTGSCSGRYLAIPTRPGPCGISSARASEYRTTAAGDWRRLARATWSCTCSMSILDRQRPAGRLRGSSRGVLRRGGGPRRARQPLPRRARHPVGSRQALAVRSFQPRVHLLPHGNRRRSRQRGQVNQNDVAGVVCVHEQFTADSARPLAQLAKPRRADIA